MATTQRQSMQPQPQMLGQSMPPNVGAGIGQSHETLQPQQQLPPYQQSVMPQKSAIRGPPPPAGEENCSGCHDATCGNWRTYRTQCTASTARFSPTAASQYGYTVWPMVPPMMRQQNTALHFQNMVQNVPQGF